MSDLISRQQAIEALGKEPKFKIKMIKTYAEGRSDQWFKDVASIASLPSAEPKTPSNGSITCVKSEKMHVRPTDDLISRQDAIKAVEEERFPVDSDYAEGFMAALDKVGWILKEWLPSAQKAQLSEEDATSVCKCPCEYREPCDDCYYEAYRGHGCPAKEGLKDERHD